MDTKQVLIVLIGGFLLSVQGLPLIESDDGLFLEDYTEKEVNTTEVPKDLYVVRAIVYEVGILANVSSSEEDDSDSDEEIDLSFFRQHRNSSIIDLSNIPTPIQTNISRQIITGIAPINFHQIIAPLNATATGKIVPLSFASAAVSLQSNLSTVNATEGENILSKIQPLLSSNFSIKHDES